MQQPQGSQLRAAPPQQGNRHVPTHNLNAGDLFYGLDPTMSQQQEARLEQENRQPAQQAAGVPQPFKPRSQQPIPAAPGWQHNGRLPGQQQQELGHGAPQQRGHHAAGQAHSMGPPAPAAEGSAAKRPRLDAAAAALAHRTPQSTVNDPAAAHRAPLGSGSSTAEFPGQQQGGRPGVAAGQQAAPRLPIARQPARTPRNLEEELMEDELVELEELEALG
jgi:hypothetical protein